MGSTGARSEGESKPTYCPLCTAETVALAVRDRAGITRFQCPYHGLIAFEIDLGDFHWKSPWDE